MLVHLVPKVVPQSDNLNLIESWIEAGMSSPLARGSGQFDQFSGTEETKVPAFCLHLKRAVVDVGGWDTNFITSQDSDLSMRMKNKGYQLFRTSDVKVQMSKEVLYKVGQKWASDMAFGEQDCSNVTVIASVSESIYHGWDL